MDRRNSITTNNSSSRPKHHQQNPSYFVASPVANNVPPPPLLSARDGSTGNASWSGLSVGGLSVVEYVLMHLIVILGRFQLIYPNAQQPVPLSHYVKGPPTAILLPIEQPTIYTPTQPKALPKMHQQHQQQQQQQSNKRPAEHLVNEKYKTALCKSYANQGYCAYGAQCLFAHGESELRNQKFKKGW